MLQWQKIIDRIYALRFKVDRKDHHKEDNVLEHSLQALSIAQKESYNVNLWAAALLHDLGKGVETLGHDQIGVDILKSFGYNNKKVFWLIENHIRVLWFLDGSMTKNKKVQELLNHKWFKDLVHLRRIDYSARKPDKTTIFNKIAINTILEVTNEA